MFILPSAGRELLLSVAPRLLWEATYRTDGYDYEDFDDLTAIVAQTEHGLMNGVKMTDLISAIENGFSNLEDAIAALDFSCPEPPAITLTCCNNADSLGIPDEPPEEIPTYPESPPTTPEPETETYLDYKCSATHKYLDNVRYIIDNFMDLTLQQTPYQWIYDLMTTEEFGAPIFQALIAVLNFVVNNAYALLHDDTLEAYDAISEQLLCNIYTAPTPAEAYQEMSDTIDASETWFGIRYILNIIVVQMTDLTPLWVEDDVDVTGYETSTCPCSTATDTYDYIEAFSTDKGLYGGVMGWRSDNGGEMYSIGHVADKPFGIRRSPMLGYWEIDHEDCEAWFADYISITVSRNVAQAVDTEFYAVFRYRDGTESGPVSRNPNEATDATYKTYTFVNPNPYKPLWDTQAVDLVAVEIVLPGVPGASTWYEYFITSARLAGGYTIGTYTDYGDTRP